MGKTNNTPVPQQDGGNEYLDTIYNSYVQMAPKGKTPLSKEAFTEKLNDEEYRGKVLNSLKTMYDGIDDNEFNTKIPIKKKRLHSLYQLVRQKVLLQHRLLHQI